ncbi:MAG TPA: hypothetical protein VFT22_07300 [Kofleriaceae bacterium]|nr:hypothetical protein [Kofleriaceae bacterium]
MARGTQSTVPGGVIQPNDNDTGGTYTTISNTNYSGFTDSFAGLFRRPSASNAKVGFATNAQWGGTSVGSGAGDEITSMWVELKNVQVGAPHTFAQVERANGTNGIVTGPTITTTVPCLILSVWFGNGTVLTAGQSHTAVPIGGLQEISGCNRLISLSTSGYIQVNAAWRIAAPGTFAEQWQTGVGTSEGAQVVTVAYQDLSTISIGDDEQAPPRQVSRALAGALALVAGVAAEELPPQTAPATVDDETSFIMRRSALGWQSGVFAATDELAPAMLEDEPALAARPWPAPRWISYQAAPDEELASWAIEEDTASSAASQLLQTWTLRVQWPAEDEMPTFVVASPMVEDEPAFPIPVWPAISASPLLAAAEELASGLLPDHVRITGISPDPEVYGEMPLNQEIYGGS